MLASIFSGMEWGKLHGSRSTNVQQKLQSEFMNPGILRFNLLKIPCHIMPLASFVSQAKARRQPWRMIHHLQIHLQPLTRRCQVKKTTIMNMFNCFYMLVNILLYVGKYFIHILNIELY